MRAPRPRRGSLLSGTDLAYLLAHCHEVDALGNPKAFIMVTHTEGDVPDGVTPAPGSEREYLRQCANGNRRVQAQARHHARRWGLIARSSRVTPAITRIWMEIPGGEEIVLDRRRQGPQWLKRVPSKWLSKREALRIWRQHGDVVFESVFGVPWPTMNAEEEEMLRRRR